MFQIDVRLTENTAKGTHSYFCLFRHYGGVDQGRSAPNELYMTTLLTRLNKAHRFKTTLDLAVRLRD